MKPASSRQHAKQLPRSIGSGIGSGGLLGGSGLGFLWVFNGTLNGINFCVVDPSTGDCGQSAKVSAGQVMQTVCAVPNWSTPKSFAINIQSANGQISQGKPHPWSAWLPQLIASELNLAECSTGSAVPCKGSGPGPLGGGTGHVFVWNSVYDGGAPGTYTVWGTIVFLVGVPAFGGRLGSGLGGGLGSGLGGGLGLGGLGSGGGLGLGSGGLKAPSSFRSVNTGTVQITLT